MEQLEEEDLLATQMAREAEDEKAATLKQRGLLRELCEHNMRENGAMTAFNERSGAIEDEEDRKIREMAIAEMDEADLRRSVDEARHRARLLAREKLIEAERKRQEATRTVQQDFLDQQIEEQVTKDQAAITANLGRTGWLVRARERARRQDFVESLALKAPRAEQKKERELKTVFPFHGHVPDSDAARDRDEARARNSRDLFEFQKQQEREKRDREGVEKGRTRLEFLHERQKEQAELETAPQYAKDLLSKGAAADEDLG